MLSKRTVLIMGLAIVMALMVFALDQESVAAGAQDDDDLSAAERQALRNAADASGADPEAPTTVQKILGFGSVAVAIAVVKWL